LLADGPDLQHLPPQHTWPELQHTPLLVVPQHVWCESLSQHFPLQQDWVEPQDAPLQHVDRGGAQ